MTAGAFIILFSRGGSGEGVVNREKVNVNLAALTPDTSQQFYCQNKLTMELLPTANILRASVLFVGYQINEVMLFRINLVIKMEASH